MDFPTGIAVGYVITDGTRNWRWNGYAWDLNINYGQVATVMVPISYVYIFTPKMPLMSTPSVGLNYV